MYIYCLLYVSSIAQADLKLKLRSWNNLLSLNVNIIFSIKELLIKSVDIEIGGEEKLEHEWSYGNIIEFYMNNNNNYYNNNLIYSFYRCVASAEPLSHTQRPRFDLRHGWNF